MFIVWALAQGSLSSTLRKKSTTRKGEYVFRLRAVPTPACRKNSEENAGLDALSDVATVWQIFYYKYVKLKFVKKVKMKSLLF